MLRKNQTDFKFIRPMSHMRKVLDSIDKGNKYIREICKETDLKTGQVKQALKNLRYIGAVQLTHDKSGVTIYIPHGTWIDEVAPNLRGVSSIFNVR